MLILASIKKLFSSRFLIRRGLLQFIETNFQGKHYGLVIDVGAGRAPYRNLIDCDKYIAVDIERRGNIENLIIADINIRLPIESNTADLVIITEVLEHLRDPIKAISEIHRVLKPGGRVIITTPLLWPIHEEPNDYQRYTKYGLRLFLENRGFKDIKIAGYGNYVLSLIILCMFPLRRRIFIPVVVILNIIGFMFLKFGPGSSVFPISNYAIATK